MIILAEKGGALAALLRERRFEALTALLVGESATLRKLMSLLYTGEGDLGWLAVLALGNLARNQPHSLQRLVSRLAWSLNDEASTCGGLAAAALGEMTAANPALTENVVRIVVHYLEDEESCHGPNRNVDVLCAVLWAVARVATRRPDLAREVLPTLIRCTRDPDPRVRGHAAFALGFAGVDEDPLQPLHNDRERVNIFDPLQTEFIELEVGQWALRARTLLSARPPHRVQQP